jgi:hypothetical protein
MAFTSKKNSASRQGTDAKEVQTELAAAFVDAANQCAKHVLSALAADQTQKERDEAWFDLVCEFLYCLLHVADRFAFSILGAEGRTKLIYPLGLLVAGTLTETHLAHWPLELKERIELEFMENLNEAQREYSAGNELLAETKPLSKNAVLDRAAFNIVGVVGDPDDVANLLYARHMAVTAVTSIDIRGLIGRIRPT